MIRGMSTPAMIRVPCSKTYVEGDTRVAPVELAVMHWTASPPKAPGMSDPARMAAWLRDPNRKSSTHFIVMRDGSILQAADLDERTWHAGGSRWVDPAGAIKGAINARSIGIDVENVGYVARAPDGGFVDGYGGRYRGLPPVCAKGGHYEPLTSAQTLSAVALCRWIAQSVPILRDPTRWVSHSSIQPGKSDPGPIFPWQTVRDAVATATRLETPHG